MRTISKHSKMFSIETANIFFKDFLGDSDRLKRERGRKKNL